MKLSNNVYQQVNPEIISQQKAKLRRVAESEVILLIKAGMRYQDQNLLIYDSTGACEGISACWTALLHTDTMRQLPQYLSPQDPRAWRVKVETRVDAWGEQYFYGQLKKFQSQVGRLYEVPLGKNRKTALLQIRILFFEIRRGSIRFGGLLSQSTLARFCESMSVPVLMHTEWLRFSASTPNLLV